MNHYWQIMISVLSLVLLHDRSGLIKLMIAMGVGIAYVDAMVRHKSKQLTLQRTPRAVSGPKNPNMILISL